MPDAVQAYSNFSSSDGPAASTRSISTGSRRHTLLLVAAALIALGLGIGLGYVVRDSQSRNSAPPAPAPAPPQPLAPLSTFSASLVANGYAVDSVLYGPTWAPTAGLGTHARAAESNSNAPSLHPGLKLPPVQATSLNRQTTAPCSRPPPTSKSCCTCPTASSTCGSRPPTTAQLTPAPPSAPRTSCPALSVS
jgi:hypothetical protein